MVGIEIGVVGHLPKPNFNAARRRILERMGVVLAGYAKAHAPRRGGTLAGALHAEVRQVTVRLRTGAADHAFYGHMLDIGTIPHQLSPRTTRGVRTWRHSLGRSGWPASQGTYQRRAIMNVYGVGWRTADGVSNFNHPGIRAMGFMTKAVLSSGQVRLYDAIVREELERECRAT